MMSKGLSNIDFALVGLYLLSMVGLSWRFARRQRSGTEYFLAGRSFGGWPLGVSILANQASAVSLVGAPAFVALREGGGLGWLQYELAVPLAMLALIVFFLPTLRSVSGASIYAYAERRFGPTTRRALAGVFLLSRGLALGVILYTSSLVVSAATGLGVTTSMFVVGLVSVAYTSLGGIVADIWSDVIQFVLLWVGTLAALVYLVREPGVVAAVPLERVQALHLDLGAAAGPFSLGPMLVGGFFLYLGYYGCDQSQAQRLLTASSDEAARKALLLNGLLRFPMVLTYCVFGLLLAGYVQTSPEFAAHLAGRPIDSLVPQFINTVLPVGLRGLFTAGILAAAMSSIDSALNSLAAVTLEDVLGQDPAAQGVWVGRLTSLLWGLFAVASGWYFAHSGEAVLELVNRVGSLFAGPLLGVFTLGILAPRVAERPALVAFGGGLATNLALAVWISELPWLWWNPAGWLMTVGAGLVGSRSLPRFSFGRVRRRDVLWLGGAFLVILGLLALTRWA